MSIIVIFYESLKECGILDLHIWHAEVLAIATKMRICERRHNKQTLNSF